MNVRRKPLIGRNHVPTSAPGAVPDGSVVMGNPARVVMSTEIADLISARNRNLVDTRGLPFGEHRRKIMERLGIEDTTP